MYRSLTPIFTGSFAASRRALDYTWHANYTAERQAVQDAIIKDMLAGGRVSKRPWLAHTAGAMGAGKSHVIRALARAGAFPLAAFVTIDPDRVKDALPEAPALVAADPARAGSLLHKESVFICEVAEHEALAASKCVLVDGSLRDAAWFSTKFKTLKKERPEYRTAIIHVTASREAVYARAAARARMTGRTVPRDVIDAALDRVPLSVQQLKPLVDYVVHITNDNDEEGGGGESPSAASFTFEAPETLASFRSVWEDVWKELEANGGGSGGSKGDYAPGGAGAGASPRL